MKKLKIELLYENGKLFANEEISYFLFQPKLLIIDGKYYVQQFDGGTKYQQTFPQTYKQG